MTSKKTTPSSKKTVSKQDSTGSEYKTQLIEAVDMSRALVREIDNLMSSNLPPAQVGKVLGDVVTGFSKQIEALDPDKK
jgi:hypothetical protein